MNELQALGDLARALGVHTHYTDGLGNPVSVKPETLVRICGSLGAPLTHPAEAPEALRAHHAAADKELLPPVLVAWDGRMPPLDTSESGPDSGMVALESGASIPLTPSSEGLRPPAALPLGYHRLSVERSGRTETCTLISSPTSAWRRNGAQRSWGVAAHLAALRSARSRSLGDLRDLESLCRWVGRLGGDLVAVLPLLPTFNTDPAEPSPYSPVSRLFWSELILDLEEAHRPSGPVMTLDVRRSADEVEKALAEKAAPDPSSLDEELLRYARFRGAQARLGRNWRDWPAQAREGRLSPEDADPEVERFHLVAQMMARAQLADLRAGLEKGGVRLGLDLAVGVHPDGYDPWSRQALFAEGMSVGAPPDPGFPSGQDWGFSPVLPGVSRQEGHRYLATSIAHQAGLSGVLRVDHVMSFTRLYWIPHGFGLHEGTYVSYPAEELLALLTLESHRARCEVVGENLGTVPPEINEALDRHRIRGTYVAQFQAAGDPAVTPPTATQIAQVGTHDTPTFAGWIEGVDIEERVRCGLLKEEEAPAVRWERSQAAIRLAERVGQRVEEPGPFLAEVLEWLGRSESPLIVSWLEDCWLERDAVNLPGTGSSQRPNWQRPMRMLLDEVFSDPQVGELLQRLHRSRNTEGRES